jgi:hypothetical protein
MNRVFVVLLVSMLLASFVTLAPLHADNKGCWEGVLIPLPWNPTNCAPFDFIDCYGCELIVVPGP